MGREKRLVVLVGLVGLAALLLAGGVAQAQGWSRTVTVNWVGNTESDLKDYKLYENGALVDVIPAGTEEAVRVITEPGTYSWYLTARDLSLNESGPSNTVSLPLDAVAPSVPSLSITITITVGP